MNREPLCKIDDVALVRDLFQENGVLQEKIRTALNAKIGVRIVLVIARAACNGIF